MKVSLINHTVCRGGTEGGEVDVGQVVLRTEIICGVQVREGNKWVGGSWMQDRSVE